MKHKVYHVEREPRTVLSTQRDRILESVIDQNGHNTAFPRFYDTEGRVLGSKAGIRPDPSDLVPRSRAWTQQEIKDAIGTENVLAIESWWPADKMHAMKSALPFLRQEGTTNTNSGSTNTTPPKPVEPPKIEDDETGDGEDD